MAYGNNFTYEDAGTVLEIFEGHPKDFNFKLQTANYEAIKAILAVAGLELTFMKATKFVAHLRYADSREMTTLTRFIAYVGDQSDARFIWNKYEGNVSGGGQNKVRFAGEEMKLTTFLAMDEFMRAIMLMSGKPAYKKKRNARKLA
jgi:hypothetical protein